MKRELKAEAERHFSRAVVKKPMDLFPRLHRVSGIFHVEENSDAGRPAQNKRLRAEHNVFYQQFRPVILVLTAFGRLSLQRNADGEYKWNWFSWLSLYCLVNYAVQTYLAVAICRQRIKAVVESSNYDEFIFAIHILAYIQMHFHVPISYWVQGPLYAQYLNHWTQFQDEWFLLTREKLKFRHKKATLAFVVVMLPSLALLLVMEKYSTLHDPFEYLLPHFFTIGSTACVLSVWYIACLEISLISKDLTQHLIKRLHTDPDPTFLQKWRTLWINLGSLVTDLGTNHFAIMASIFLTFSLTFLLGLYNALSKIIIGDISLKTTGYLTASGMSILIIYIVCDSGHQATARVESYASQCILSSHLPAACDDIKYEIDLILRVVQTDPPQIQLAGFVTLNRPLFISFVANTITYLIVILQFKG
nr:GR1 [Adelphocoris fasciaticollis]